MAADKEATAAAADGEKGAAAAAAEQEVTGAKMITLKSNDGKLFQVPEAAARQSTLLRGMIEGNCTADGVPLPDIAAAPLEKVVEYLTKHAEAAADPRSVAASNQGVCAAAGEELKRWDADLVGGLGTGDALFDLILAADYLVVDGLLDAACKKIADMMKGKSVKQIRDTFNIPDDFTEEEKEEMRQEYAWAFPKGHPAVADREVEEDDDEDEEEEGEHP